MSWCYAVECSNAEVHVTAKQHNESHQHHLTFLFNLNENSFQSSSVLQ